MKFWVTCLLVFVGASSLKAQSKSERLAELIKYVENVDSLSGKQFRTFYLVKIGKNNSALKETWHYTLINGKVAVFQIRYTIDSIEFNEVYYLEQGELICSEEYETIYKTDDDELKYGGIYYYSNYDLLQLITLGHKFGLSDNFQRDKPGIAIRMMDRFKDRYAELKENLVYR